jgi:hypothetical protein
MNVHREYDVRTSAALTDDELDGVNGAGFGTKILGIAITTGGVLTTAGGVLSRQWGVAARGCNMIVDGITHIEQS